MFLSISWRGQLFKESTKSNWAIFHWNRGRVPFCTVTETRRLAEKSATRGKGPSTEPSCGSRRAQLTSEFVLLVEQPVTKENKFISIKEMALRRERERGRREML